MVTNPSHQQRQCRVCSPQSCYTCHPLEATIPTIFNDGSWRLPKRGESAIKEVKSFTQPSSQPHLWYSKWDACETGTWHHYCSPQLLRSLHCYACSGNETKLVVFIRYFLEMPKTSILFKIWNECLKRGTKYYISSYNIKKVFTREIHHCLYTISGYQSNELSSVKTLHERHLCDRSLTSEQSLFKFLYLCCEYW
jgi:hypothetical protein